jgi:MSHA biogenesis protein MshL
VITWCASRVASFGCSSLRLALCFVLALSGCGGSQPLNDWGKGGVDPHGGLTRDDYRDLNKPSEAVKRDAVGADFNAKDAEIPDLASILVAPKPPKDVDERLVSLSVTDDVPIRDVLIELARLADVDLELMSDVTGGIIFRAKERPFHDVVDRVCSLAALRCTTDGRVLRVERDTPYLKSYPLDFLNIVRSGEASVTVNTNVLSASGTGSSGLNTGSSASITSKADSDFWASLEDGIEKILEESEPKIQAVSAVSSSAKADATSAGAAAAAGTTPADVDAANMQKAEQAAAALSAIAAPMADEVSSDSSAASTTGAGEEDDKKTYFVLNKQAGVLMVSATDAKHKRIEGYLKQIQEMTSAQVLIEAKIVEVSLTEDFASGIDWGQVAFNGDLDLDFDISSSASNSSLVIAATNSSTSANLLEAAVRLTEKFGTLRTLSNPRVLAMNNQLAVLTFAENEVYFDIDIEKEESDTVSGPSTTYTVNSEVKTVPIGLILALQPVINRARNEVTLTVRPTLSTLSRSVQDPATAYLISQTTGLKDLKNGVPVVKVREMDSVMNMKSGDVMVIGGLMDQRAKNDDVGVPGLGEIPWLGSAFKSVTKESKLVETVIFLKATIIDKSSVEREDVELYQKYTTDRRPLVF